ncbi:MAG TPA: cyclic nucleotide-binding domain-containing protein, partial [Myxococcales bacterium]|nr:cyclic nucleotide-binding domain-containing protein [Myxococcales bacterium]
YLADEDLGLFIVCDGMGGHAAGEIASSRCVEVIQAEIARNRQIVEELRINPASTAAAVSLLENAVELASSDIYRAAQAEEAKRGMGTTVVALIVAGSKAVLAHVGDSRVYLLRAGQVHRLTEDHTFVQEQIKRGLITREQAASAGENRNVITRAVGIQPQVAVDTLVADVLPGDLFVLCSDGLHGYLPDEEVSQVFGQDRTKLAGLLVDLALERGGKDNVTAVCVSVENGAGAAEAEEIEGKTDTLRRIPLFQHMTYKELLALLGIAHGRQFEKGQHIINEGEGGNEMFVLFRGKVDVLKSGHRIAQLSGGGHFGEMGLVDRAPRSATVIAAEDTSAISIDRDSLLKLMRRESLLAIKLLWSFVGVLSERLRTTNEALTDVKLELDELRNPTKKSGPQTYKQ